MHTQNVKTATQESTGRWGADLEARLTAWMYADHSLKDCMQFERAMLTA